MSRWLLVLILLIGPAVWARTTDRDVNAILLSLKKGEAHVYARAEKLYSDADSETVAARLASLLAFAPAGETTVPAHIYAQFAFHRDASLPLTLKLKMAKLAGEGFFNHAEFAAAMKIFNEAVHLPGLDESEQEYFQYQMAWCQLNLHQSQQAIATWLMWLRSCHKCQLRKEMVFHLGRAWVEAGLKPEGLTGQLSATDGPAFVDGVLQALERQHLRLDVVSQHFARPLIGAWLVGVFSKPTSVGESECVRLTALSATDSSVWPVGLVRAALDDCAKKALQLKSAGRDWQELTQLYALLPDKTQLNWLLQGSLFERQTRYAEACSSRLRAVQAPAQGASLLAIEAFLPALLSGCAKASHPEVYARDIAALIAQPELVPQFKVKGEWLRYFLQQVEPISSWRKAVDVKDLMALGPDPILLRQLIAQQNWELPFRQAVWRSSPTVVAQDFSVLKAAGESAPEVRGRIQAPSAKLAYFGGRHDEALYHDVLGARDWNDLPAEARAELIGRLFHEVPLGQFIQDWAAWQPLVATDPVIFTAWLEAALADGGNTPAPTATDPYARLIAGFMHRDPKAFNGEGVADTHLTDDLKTARTELESTAQAQLSAGSDEEFADSLDRGMHIYSQAIRTLSRYKWTYKPVALFARRTIKDGLNGFSANAATAMHAVPARAGFLPLLKVMKRWEKAL